VNSGPWGTPSSAAISSRATTKGRRGRGAANCKRQRLRRFIGVYSPIPLGRVIGGFCAHTKMQNFCKKNLKGETSPGREGRLFEMNDEYILLKVCVSYCDYSHMYYGYG
jgi:hypothetical protein